VDQACEERSRRAKDGRELEPEPEENDRAVGGKRMKNLAPL
jgi:hypothetical protein